MKGAVFGGIHIRNIYILAAYICVSFNRSHFLKCLCVYVFQDLDVIFSNILDVEEFTSNIINSLEDALEMAEENPLPNVGGIFEELAEVRHILFYLCV